MFITVDDDEVDMKSTKNYKMDKLLRAFFVINRVIQIQCSHSNNDVSDKLIDSSDKRLGKELNPKYIEGVCR